MSDINGGFSPNANGSPIQPGTAFTGPLIAGGVFHSDGTGTLAGLGGTTGTANQGYVVMAQTAVVTQASGATTIVVPAQSQILSISLMVTTAFTGVAATLSVGATAGTTAATAFSANTVSAASAGLVAVTPTTTAQIANWDNVSNATFQTVSPTDVQIKVTSANTGSGVATLTVTYVQGINNAS